MEEEMQIPLLAQLQEMAQTDFRTVDPKDLVDVESVTIRTDLSDKERVADFLRQIKNPYCYLYRGMVVKVSFSGKRRLEDCLKDCLFTNI